MVKTTQVRVKVDTSKPTKKFGDLKVGEIFVLKRDTKHVHIKFKYKLTKKDEVYSGWESNAIYRKVGGR